MGRGESNHDRRAEPLLPPSLTRCRLPPDDIDDGRATSMTGGCRRCSILLDMGWTRATAILMTRHENAPSAAVRPAGLPFLKTGITRSRLSAGPGDTLYRPTMETYRRLPRRARSAVPPTASPMERRIHFEDAGLAGSYVIATFHNGFSSASSPTHDPDQSGELNDGLRPLPV